MKRLKNIKLENYIGNDNIVSKSFDYSGITGNAEIMGWQIVVFRRTVNGNISALSMDEIDSPIIKDVCAGIFKDLGLPLSAGMKINVLSSLLGSYSYQDNILEDITRYYFEVQDYLIICGIHNKNGLNNIEIIYDEELVNNRIKWCLSQTD